MCFLPIVVTMWPYLRRGTSARGREGGMRLGRALRVEALDKAGANKLDRDLVYAGPREA